MVQEDAFGPVLLHWVDPICLVHLADLLELTGHLLEDEVEAALVLDVVLIFSEVLVRELLVDVVEGGQALDVSSVLSIVERPLDEVLDIITAREPSLL